MTLNIHDIFSLDNVIQSKGDKFVTFDIKFIGMGKVSIILSHALNNQSMMLIIIEVMMKLYEFPMCSLFRIKELTIPIYFHCPKFQ